MPDEKTRQNNARQAERGSPRLPHEHDESLDSQVKPGDKPNRRVIEQAHDDIVTGQKDTDLRGTPGLDKAGG